MKYDEILEELGDFGTYQRLAYFYICIPAMMKAAIVMSAVFILSLPEFSCIYPEITSINKTLWDKEFVNGSVIRILSLDNPSNEINASIRGDPSSHQRDPCQICANIEIRSLNESHSGQPRNVSVRSHILKSRFKCHEWKYEESNGVRSSIMTEFNLVCDKKSMRAHINMGFFLGSLVGAFIFGTLADKVGRRKAALMCVFVQFVSGSIQYFITSLIAVVAVRSIQGMAGEMFAISASTGMELVGPRRRDYAGIGLEFFWTAGQLLVVLVAYVSKDWRVIQLVFGLLAIPLFVVSWLTPESPRWLIDQGKTKQAAEILEKIAKANQTKLPDKALKTEEAMFGSEVKIWRLFSNKRLLFRSVIIFYNWFTVNFLFYGLSLNLENLAGSIYLNFLIGTAVECMAFVLCFVLVKRVRRKRFYTVCMFTGAVCCIMVIFPVFFGTEDHQWIINVLAMTGKMLAACCYAILYIISTEMFPTIGRNSALGICMLFENVAGMISPYISDLGELVGSGTYTQALPLVTFGSVALVASGLCLFLPETQHLPMSETIEDAINLDRTSQSKANS